MSALIILFILYTILTPSNIIRQSTETSNFKEIAKNFERESAHFLNNLIKSQQPIYNAFLNFTLLFTSYAKTKNPDVGIIYTFIHGNTLYIGNYAHDKATFQTSTAAIAIKGCLDDVKTSFSVAGLDIAIQDVDILNYQDCLKTLTLLPTFDNILNITITEPDTSSTTFTIGILSSHPDIVIISKEKQGNIRRIYTKGTFI